LENIIKLNFYPIRQICVNLAAGPRHRPTRRPSSTSTNAHARSRSRSLKTDQNVQKEYTNEEEAFIARIRHCKDYYEILEVTKTEFNEAMLKKKYRELALRLHPDKCKAPGATEAFKGKELSLIFNIVCLALGNAYAVLSDCKKREEYDRYGAEDTRNIRRNNSSEFYEYDINRGFEGGVKMFLLYRYYF
jgi:hypothetical protein